MTGFHSQRVVLLRLRDYLARLRASAGDLRIRVRARADSPGFGPGADMQVVGYRRHSTTRATDMRVAMGGACPKEIAEGGIFLI